MTEQRDKANDIYHSCETHGDIVDKIERMLELKNQNADLLAVLEMADLDIDDLLSHFQIVTQTDLVKYNEAELNLVKIRAAIAKAVGG